MKLIIFGASRGTGRSLAELALAQGHQVTAVARNPSGLNLNHALLNVLAGDVTNTAFVEQSLKGHEMVFCTVGSGPRSGAQRQAYIARGLLTGTRGATTLFSFAAHNITKAMNNQGVYRLMFLSNFGVLGETASNLRTAGLVSMIKFTLHGGLQDHWRALDEIQKYDGEWMAVRPMALTDGERTGHYRIALEGLPEGGTHISRADVADFMLKQVSSNEYVHKIPAIAY